MSRRLEIEITSLRENGTFTWRVAGARQPKGEAESSLLPEGTAVGARYRVEAEFLIDGIEILSVQAPKSPRKEPERLAITGSRGSEELITARLLRGGGRRRGGGGATTDWREHGGDRERRGRRDGRDGGDRPRGDRGPRSDRGDRAPRGEGERNFRDRPRRNAPPPAPERPKAKRLRARSVHRDAFVAALPPEQQPVADQLVKGGVPAVRQALEKQNETNAAQGLPQVDPAGVLTLAENLLPGVRAAEWRDEAEAALATVEDLDLRDLRRVVVGADTAATDDETRALAAQLREALTSRADAEQNAWVNEIGELVSIGRTVRALRLSSRPPKAGSPIPTDLAKRLAEATVASVDAETTQERWGALLDALAFSPIRGLVKFENLPAEPTEELKVTVQAVADRIPAIATALGIDPASVPRQARRRPDQRRGGPGGRPDGGRRGQGGRRAEGAAGQGRDRKPERKEAAPEAAPATASTETEEPVVTGDAVDATVEAPAVTEPVAAPAAEETPAVEPEPVVETAPDVAVETAEPTPEAADTAQPEASGEE